MKTHQNNTPECISADQFYPRTEPMRMPDTYDEVVMYLQDGHDLDVYAQYMAYEGSPDVQMNILHENAQIILQSKSISEDEQETLPAPTRYVSQREPLPFYWQRTNQLDTKLDELIHNVDMYIEVVKQTIPTLHKRELIKQLATISTLASLANEDQAFELRLAVDRHARELHIENIALFTKTPNEVDRRQIA